MNPEQREFGHRLFSSLANPARIEILEFLSKGSASVKEIAEAVGLKQSMTSQHLSVLLNAGVVVCNPEGNLRVYSLRGPRITQMLELVEQFYENHLSNLRNLITRYS